MSTQTEALVVREDMAAAPMLDAAMIRHRVKVIQQIVRDVMQDKVHYGQIPGTPKKSLWQPGAEVLCLAFGVTIKCEPIEERITDEEIFYRVRATAYSSIGRELGSREAVCSTREKKYRWRRPVHVKEWEATAEHLRRTAWDKEGAEVLQVRTDPGDQQETILGMANKRAHVALTRQVTGCSDVFEITEEGDDGPEEKAPVTQPQRAAVAVGEQADLPGAAGAPDAVKILSCKKLKSGETDKGPWTLYGIKTSDGKSYTTFSQSVAVLAMKAQAEDFAVRLTSVPGRDGKDPQIEEMAKAA
jgi:hypothetical protein